MKVFIREDLNYIDRSFNGFPYVEYRMLFNKALIGKVCNVLSADTEMKSYYVKSLDGLYQHVPQECTAVVLGVRQVNKVKDLRFYQDVETKKQYVCNNNGWFSYSDDGKIGEQLAKETLVYDVETENIYELWR